MTPRLFARQFPQEARASLTLAGPVVLTFLGQMSMGLVDTLMVGRLGPTALAGVALGNTTYFLLFIVSIGVLSAVGPMVSQAFGAGDEVAIGRSVRQGLWLAVLLSLPALPGVWALPWALEAAGQPPAVVAETRAYLHAIVWGIPFGLAFATLRTFVEAVSRPLPVTLIMLVGAGLNAVANYVLMFGKLGLPALGVAGTGYASALVQTFLFVVLALYVARARPLRRFEVFRHLRSPDPATFRELFRVGWPIGATFGIEHGMFTATTLLLGQFGEAALAGHQIAIQCVAFTFMVPLGVGIAGSVRVGQAAGRQDTPGVLRAGYTAMALAVLFMCGTAVVFVTMPHTLTGFFLDLSDPQNSEVVRVAVGLLTAAAAFQVCDGLQVSAAGALRGLKDTFAPMVIGLVAYWGIGLGTGYVLAFPLGGGPTALWWGLVAGLVVASVLLFLRFRVQARQLTARDREAALEVAAAPERVELPS